MVNRLSSAACWVAVLIMAAAVWAGCANTQRPQVANPNEGERLARLLFEEGLSGNDSTVLDRTVAAEFTFHARGQSFTIPRQGLWALTRPIRSGFPDIQFRVVEVVSEGDRFAARLSFTGTHLGEWGGLEPTGRRVRVTEMFMCRIESGLVAECWQEWDEWGLREQLRVGRTRPNGA